MVTWYSATRYLVGELAVIAIAIPPELPADTAIPPELPADTPEWSGLVRSSRSWPYSVSPVAQKRVSCRGAACTMHVCLQKPDCLQTGALQAPWPPLAPVRKSTSATRPPNGSRASHMRRCKIFLPPSHLPPAVSQSGAVPCWRADGCLCCKVLAAFAEIDADNSGQNAQPSSHDIEENRLGGRWLLNFVASGECRLDRPGRIPGVHACAERRGRC